MKDTDLLLINRNGVDYKVTAKDLKNYLNPSPYTPRTSAVIKTLETFAIQPAKAANNIQWRSVTYGDGKYVAVASNGKVDQVMYSTDAINWTAASAAEEAVWMSVTYGAPSTGTYKGQELFVAITSNFSTTGGQVMYSTDGINWTSAAAAEENQWNDVTYGDGKFVAVTGTGTNRVMYSTDAINWTSASAPGKSGWGSVTYGDGKFVAVASSVTSSYGTNRVMWSTDAINWTAASQAEDNKWSSVTYGDGKFVAVGYNGTNHVMYSADAINWTAASAAENNMWFGVTYGDGMFVAVSYDGTNRLMWSTDGINWTRESVDRNEWKAVTYGGGKFVAVAGSGTNRVMYIDGATTTLTLENNKTYDNADGTDMGVPISETFLAGQTVTSSSAAATGTVVSAVDNLLTLENVGGDWSAGDFAVNDEEITT